MKQNGHDFTENKVFILGSRNLQNEFLVYVIKKEIGAQCEIYEDLSIFPRIKKEQKPYPGSELILIDSVEHSFEKIIKDIVTNKAICGEESLIAIFNMNPNTGVEQKAIRMRVKGFFYKDDHFDLFLRGIEAIFLGEIWISREVLLRTVLDNFAEKRIVIKKQTTLTQREVEILTLVGMGATNEEIAEKIFVSPNTVKTHLYNIFKKIKVRNRMQAALWAAKNL